MARWFGLLLLLASLGFYVISGTDDPPPDPDDIPGNPEGPMPTLPPPPTTVPIPQ
jgi:hypothetical protein